MSLSVFSYTPLQVIKVERKVLQRNAYGHFILTKVSTGRCYKLKPIGKVLLKKYDNNSLPKKAEKEKF